MVGGAGCVRQTWLLQKISNHVYHLWHGGFWPWYSYDVFLSFFHGVGFFFLFSFFLWTWLCPTCFLNLDSPPRLCCYLLLARVSKSASASFRFTPRRHFPFPTLSFPFSLSHFLTFLLNPLVTHPPPQDDVCQSLALCVPTHVCVHAPAPPSPLFHCLSQFFFPSQG